MKKIAIDGKSVIFKTSKHPISLSQIKKVYRKIPDDKKVPIVFESKKQYLQEYIKNQEKQNQIRFTNRQKQQYLRSELQNMRGITSRYTTRSNPYMEPRIVFFTDHKITPKQFEQNVMHEYGHELWEKDKAIRDRWSVNQNTSPTTYGTIDPEEDFAESYSFMRTKEAPDPNPSISVSELNRRMDILKDQESKNGGRYGVKCRGCDTRLNKNNPGSYCTYCKANGKAMRLEKYYERLEKRKIEQNQPVSLKEFFNRQDIDYDEKIPEQDEESKNGLYFLNNKGRIYYDNSKESIIHGQTFREVEDDEKDKSSIRLRTGDHISGTWTDLDGNDVYFPTGSGKVMLSNIYDKKEFNEKILQNPEAFENLKKVINYGLDINDIKKEDVLFTSDAKKITKIKDIVENDNSSRNYIYLAGQKSNNVIPKKSTIAAVYPEDHNDIFIHNWKHANKWPIENIADTISHEELHNELQRSINNEASKKLDNIQKGAITRKDTGELLNPNTGKKFLTEEQQQKDFLNYINKRGYTLDDLNDNINLKYKLIKEWDANYDIDYDEDSKNRISPNEMQMERLRNLPVYYQERIAGLEEGQDDQFNAGFKFDTETGQPIEKRSEENIHITDTRVPKRVQQTAYKTFKKYPNLYGEIERNKDAEIFITDQQKLSGGRDGSILGLNYSGVIKDDSGNKIREHKDKIVLGIPQRSMLNERDMLDYEDSYAGMIFHELRHTKQKNIPEFEKEERTGKKWIDLKTEHDAENYAKEKMNERLNQPNTLAYLKDTQMLEKRKRSETPGYEYTTNHIEPNADIVKQKQLEDYEMNKLQEERNIQSSINSLELDKESKNMVLHAKKIHYTHKDKEHTFTVLAADRLKARNKLYGFLAKQHPEEWDFTRGEWHPITSKYDPYTGETTKLREYDDVVPSINDIDDIEILEDKDLGLEKYPKRYPLPNKRITNNGILVEQYPCYNCGNAVDKNQIFCSNRCAEEYKKKFGDDVE